jgi:hypothetical protein
MRERIDAQSSLILARLTPAITRLAGLLERLVRWLETKGLQLLDRIQKFFEHPPDWAKGTVAWIGQLADLLGPNGSLVLALVGLTAAVGIGSAIVTGIAGLATFLAPLAAAIGGGLLLGKLIADVPSGGLLDALDAKIVDFLRAQEDERAVHAGEGRGTLRGKIIHVPATPTAPRQPSAATQSATAGQGSPTASLGGGTNVQIDSMTINTRATDADGIAGDMAGAMRRKLLVANADGGVS